MDLFVEEKNLRRRRRRREGGREKDLFIVVNLNMHELIVFFCFCSFLFKRMGKIVAEKENEKEIQDENDFIRKENDHWIPFN